MKCIISLGGIVCEVAFPAKGKGYIDKITRNFVLNDEKPAYRPEFKFVIDIPTKAKRAYISNSTARLFSVAVPSNSFFNMNTAMGTFCSFVLARTKGFLVHACLIVKDDNAYVFAGPSGSGKSTIARNAKNCLVVSDDTCGIRKIRGKWYAFGVPMLQGSRKPALTDIAPLGGIFLIRKGGRNKILNETAPQKAFHGIMKNVYIPFRNKTLKRKIFENALSATAHVRPGILIFEKHLDVTTLL